MFYRKLMIASLVLTMSVAGLAPAAGAQSDLVPTAPQPAGPGAVDGPTNPGAPEAPGSPESPPSSGNRAVTNVGAGSQLVSTAFGGQTVALDVVSAMTRTRVTEASGATVVRDAIGDVDLKITTSNSGFAVAAELESVNSPHQLRFDVSIPEGAFLVLTEEGSIDVVGKDGFTLGTFATPWAVDTNGSDVATSYSLDGNTIVQTVDPVARGLYPVIADPTFDWGWVSGTVYLTLDETSAVCLNAYNALKLVAETAPLWAFSLIGSIIAGVVGGLAAVVAPAACTAHLLSTCLKIFTYPPYLLPYSGDYCT